MGIKIYNGYQVTGLTLHALLPALAKLRKTVMGAADDLAAQYLAKVACDSFDRASLGLPPADVGQPQTQSAHLFVAKESLGSRQAEVVRSQRRDPAVDFNVSVSVHAADDQLLLLTYVEHPELRNLLTDQPWLRPLPYWDNACRLKRSLARDWKARRKLWGAALEDFGPPAATGFSFELSPAQTPVLLGPVSIATIVDNLPSCETRVERMATELRIAQLPPEKVFRYSDIERMKVGPVWDALVEKVRQTLVEELHGEHLWQSVEAPMTPKEAAQAA